MCRFRRTKREADSAVGVRRFQFFRAVPGVGGPIRCPWGPGRLSALNSEHNFSHIIISTALAWITPPMSDMASG